MSRVTVFSLTLSNKLQYLYHKLWSNHDVILVGPTLYLFTILHIINKEKVYCTSIAGFNIEIELHEEVFRYSLN